MVKNIQAFSQIKYLGTHGRCQMRHTKQQTLLFVACMIRSTYLNAQPLNALRFKLFGHHGKANMSHQTHDSFDQYLARCNYQCCEWKRSLDFSEHIRSPVGHGWDIDISWKLKNVFSTQPGCQQPLLLLLNSPGMAAELVV